MLPFPSKNNLQITLDLFFIPQLLDKADKKLHNLLDCGLIKARSCFYLNTSVPIENVLDQYERAKKIRQLQALPNAMREPDKPDSYMHLSLRGS